MKQKQFFKLLFIFAIITSFSLQKNYRNSAKILNKILGERELGFMSSMTGGGDSGKDKAKVVELQQKKEMLKRRISIDDGRVFCIKMFPFSFSHLIMLLFIYFGHQRLIRRRYFGFEESKSSYFASKKNGLESRRSGEWKD